MRIDKLRENPHWSYSAFQTYLTCPLKYKFRYIDNAEPERTGSCFPFGRAFHAELGAINSSDIVPVFKEFKNPRHEEFAEPTRWSLLNAFTETIKKYTPQRVDHAYSALNHCFGLDGNKPELWK